MFEIDRVELIMVLCHNQFKIDPLTKHTYVSHQGMLCQLMYWGNSSFPLMFDHIQNTKNSTKNMTEYPAALHLHESLTEPAEVSRQKVTY